jgi:hypothetical protein
MGPRAGLKALTKPLPGNLTRLLDNPACSLVITLTTESRLLRAANHPRILSFS